MSATTSLAMVILIFATSGCGTIDNIVGAGTPPADPAVKIDPANVVYGGVKQDAEYAWEQLHPYALAASFSGAPGGPVMPILGLCALIDLPLSAIGDTVTLPVTIPATYERRSRARRLQTNEVQRTFEDSNTPRLPTENATDATQE